MGLETGARAVAVGVGLAGVWVGVGALAPACGVAAGCVGVGVAATGETRGVLNIGAFGMLTVVAVTVAAGGAVWDAGARNCGQKFMAIRTTASNRFALKRLSAVMAIRALLGCAPSGSGAGAGGSLT